MYCPNKWSRSAQALLIVALFAAGTIVGCEKSSPPASTTGSTQDKATKTGQTDQPAGNSDSNTSPKTGKEETPPETTALIAKLKDKNANVRLRAADALRRMGQAAKDAVPALIRALRDKELKVSFDATRALGQIGPVAVPTLIRALRHPDVTVHPFAVLALGLIGPEAKASVPAIHLRISATRARIHRGHFSLDMSPPLALALLRSAFLGNSHGPLSVLL